MIREVTGDIFESQAQLLVCPVNRLGAMGAGLALEFKNRHPDLYYHYRKLLRQRRWGEDQIFIYRPEKAPYGVVMFATKHDWRDDSDIELIESQLQRLSQIDNRYGISSIAFPRIGGGLGNLDFDNQVKPLIYKYLGSKNYDVLLYI